MNTIIMINCHIRFKWLSKKRETSLEQMENLLIRFSLRQENRFKSRRPIKHFFDLMQILHIFVLLLRKSKKKIKTHYILLKTTSTLGFMIQNMRGRYFKGRALWGADKQKHKQTDITKRKTKNWLCCYNRFTAFSLASGFWNFCYK